MNKKLKNKVKLKRHLLYKFKKAVYDYGMIQKDDHVMVCLSGGKDSFALLELCIRFRDFSPEKYKISALFLDHQFPGFPISVIQEYFETLDVKTRIIRQNIYKTMKEKIPKGKTLCGLCGRLRRGALYRYAEENGVTKIALGHHMDDIIETLFLNMFFGGKIKGMPPSYITDNERHCVIRPLCYIRESDIVQFAREMNFPVINGNYCGMGEKQERQEIKKMLALWQKQYPGRVEKIFSGMQNVEIDTLAVKSSVK